MDTPPAELTAAAEALRQDLGTEHQGLLKIVSEFDGRLMIVKGWSVTLSLAGLGLGFQTGHYALFAIAAATALGFWFIDAQVKRHQMHYYARMRDIEVAAYHLNHQTVDGVGVSAPLVDWYWGYTGAGPDFRLDPPQRRTPEEVRKMLAQAPWMPHVFLPHAVAVLLGIVLFFGALMDVDGLSTLTP
ncbi:hypothetical protein [Paractinoplanes maris]|uniref:hypothetical protein n=1 Tax=Paractinoplanes maris TaxID=1734446 RepID=UPI0020200D4D|nr:hypothetical protein [Actinoplanes maris]